MFDFFGMGSGLFEPVEHRFGMEVLDAGGGTDAVAFGNQEQRLDDQVGGFLFAIEEGSFVFGEGFIAGFAAEALFALFGFAVLDNGVILRIVKAITVGVGAKLAGLGKLRHGRSVVWWCNVLIYAISQQHSCRTAPKKHGCGIGYGANPGFAGLLVGAGAVVLPVRFVHLLTSFPHILLYLTKCALFPGTLNQPRLTMQRENRPTRIVTSHNLSADMAAAILAKVCLAYMEADDHVNKAFRKATARNHYPYERLARLDDLLYRLPQDFPEWKAYDRPNASKNCSHVELVNGTLRMTASAVRNKSEVVRSAVFRHTLARPNLQLDLFNPVEPAPVDGDYYAILLHGPDPRNQSRPAFFQLAFPVPEGGYVDVIDLLDEYDLRIDAFYESAAPVETIPDETTEIPIKPDAQKRRVAE